MNRQLFISFLLLLASCANRVIPTGGDKDTKPPVLLQAIPSDGATSFQGKSIRFVFDELIQTGDASAQLIVSPPMSPSPTLRVNRNELIMRLPDTLEQNTTYSFDFGKLISDMHEGNPLFGFRYAFSTGESLDTLELRGSVSDAWTRTGAKDVAMLLYWKTESRSSADSLMLSGPCDFFARSDDSGRFAFRNLPAGSFFLFACADKNANRRYDDPANELFGFLDAPVQLPSGDSISMDLSLQRPSDWRILRAVRTDRYTAMISFNRPDTQVAIKGLNGTTDMPSASFYSAFRDTLYLFTGADSLRIRFERKGAPADTVLIRMIPPVGAKEPNFKLRPQLLGGPASAGPDEPLRFTVGHPIARADSAFMILIDSLPPVPVMPVVTDSVKGEFLVAFEWKEGSAVRVEAMPGALRDVFGNTNDTVRIRFTVPTAENTSLLTVRTSGVNRTGSGLLQLVDEKGNERRGMSIVSDTLVTFRFLSPGNLRIRFIADRDGDGRWSSGDWRSGTRPEAVIFHPEPIQLRPNWENEVLFQITTP